MEQLQDGLQKMVDAKENERNRMIRLINEFQELSVEEIIGAYENAWLSLPSCEAMMESAHQEGVAIFAALYDDKSQKAYEAACRALVGYESRETAGFGVVID